MSDIEDEDRQEGEVEGDGREKAQSDDERKGEADSDDGEAPSHKVTEETPMSPVDGLGQYNVCHIQQLFFISHLNFIPSLIFIQYTYIH